MVEKDPGGQGTGYPVPPGQKCPTGQMSLPGRPRLDDSTCIRKTQKRRGKSVIERFSTVYYRDNWKGHIGAESYEFAATEIK